MARNSAPKLRPASNSDREAVLALLTSVLAEYGLHADPCNTDADLDDLEFHYHRRNGFFDVLETSDGQVIGCVGLYPVDTHCCELRKMYLKKEMRRKGLGKRLLEHALQTARQLGYKRVTLETASVLTEAITLYRKYGFQPFNAQHLAKRCDQAFVLDLDEPHATVSSGTRSRAGG